MVCVSRSLWHIVLEMVSALCIVVIIYFGKTYVCPVVQEYFVRMSQMKTLNIFYLVSYWTHRVHNDIIFLQSSLCSIQVFQRFGSAWIPLEEMSFGWECSHSCTACCISLSDLKDLPPIASLSGPKMWKSLEVRSGEYGICGRRSKDRSWIVATVEQAI